MRSVLAGVLWFVVALCVGNSSPASTALRTRCRRSIEYGTITAALIVARLILRSRTSVRTPAQPLRLEPGEAEGIGSVAACR